jgi:uncharacterized membrane protein SirB2
MIKVKANPFTACLKIMNLQHFKRRRYHLKANKAITFQETLLHLELACNVAYARTPV